MADDPSEKKPKKDPPFQEKPWQAKDGSDYHEIMLRPAEDRYVDEAGVSRVEVEHEVQRVQNGEIVGNGRVDMLIDNREVIDIKTHQMDGWETADQAKKEGAAFAEKINEYVDSPQVADDARGHLYMVGTRNADPAIEKAFADGAAEYGVSVTFVDDANPEAVLSQIDTRFGLSAPETELIETVSSKTPQSTDSEPFRRHTLNLQNAAGKLDKKIDESFGETFANMEDNSSGFFRQEAKETFTEVRADHSAPEHDMPMSHTAVPTALIGFAASLAAGKKGWEKAQEKASEYYARYWLGAAEPETVAQAVQEVTEAQAEIEEAREEVSGVEAALSPILRQEASSEIEAEDLQQYEEHEHGLTEVLIEEGAIHGSLEVASEQQNDEQQEAEQHAEECREQQQAADERYAEVRSEDFAEQQSEAYRAPEPEPPPRIEESRRESLPEPEPVAVPDLEPDDGDQGMEM